MRQFSRPDAWPEVVYRFGNPPGVSDLGNEHRYRRLPISHDLIHHCRRTVLSILKSSLGTACQVAPGGQRIGLGMILFDLARGKV